MIPEIITFSRYRCVPRNLTLTAGKKQKTFKFADGMIVYMNIIHNYVGSRVPVIQMGMEMEMEQIIAIYEDVEKAVMSVDIVEEQFDGTDTVVGTSPYISHTFNLVPMRDRTVYITSDDYLSDDNVNDMRRDLQLFETYLVDKEALDWFDKESDFNHESASLPGVLKEIVVSRGIGGKRLFTPPANCSTAKNISIPLGTLIGNIKSLNEKYGLYDNNPIVYYDYKYFYCLSKVKPNIVFEHPPDFGTVTFLLRSKVEADHNVQGSFNDKENEIHWINLTNEPQIDDDTIMDGSAKMSTLMTVNSGGNVTQMSVDNTGKALSYAYATSDLTSEQIANDTMIGQIISVSASNTSVRFLRPYKDYTFIIDSSYRNLNLNARIFRLTSWAVNIRREGSSTHYVNDVNLILYEPRA